MYQDVRQNDHTGTSGSPDLELGEVVLEGGEERQQAQNLGRLFIVTQHP